MEQPVKTEIYNYRAWIADVAIAPLKDRLAELLKDSGYRVVNFTEHYFSPQGYTCMWLLAESHLAVHTYPEEGRIYLELSGCVYACNHSFTERLHQCAELQVLSETTSKS